jgi:hypothetical protein
MVTLALESSAVAAPKRPGRIIWLVDVTHPTHPDKGSMEPSTRPSLLLWRSGNRTPGASSTESLCGAPRAGTGAIHSGRCANGGTHARVPPRT